MDGNVTLTSERGGDTRPDAFLKISDKALEEMAKNMEELMKKDGWDDESTSSAVDQSQQATNTEEKEPPSFYGITSPQEFKKSDASRDVDDVSLHQCTTSPTDKALQDNAKLFWNMTKILFLDPCRRFTLGLTIENRSLRLWKLSRGAFLKSRPFDFLKVRASIPFPSIVVYTLHI